MKLFKFDWFSSKEREKLEKEKEQLRKEKENLEKSLEESYLEKTRIELELIAVKNSTKGDEIRPYKNIYYVDKTLTVISNDGDIITQIDVEKEKYESVLNCKSFSDIKDILFVKDKISAEKSFDLSPFHSVLETHPDFIKVGENFQLRGINLTIPDIVLSSFIESIEKNLIEEYESLKRFWALLAMNGMESSRKDLLTFIKDNDVKITKNGNIILYRRIVSQSKAEKGLTKFVSLTYFNVKKKRKKSPKDFDVFHDKSFYIRHIDSFKEPKGRRIGNLYELYTDPSLNKENVFTSYHNKGKHTIKVGQIYKINESEINTNNGLCAAGGLHAASVSYNYSGFGDTPVVVLVNPSKTITVPVNETGKLRTTEMFIACINDKPHGVHFSENALSAFDDEYTTLTIKEIEESIKNKTFGVASIENNISPINFRDLESIKEILNKRIIKS